MRVCLVFPRPVGPEELPEALGQALCPSGPPPHSEPPHPWCPLSLGGGAPEAVEKGGLVVGGSCGVPAVGKGLVFTGPLGPGESSEAPSGSPSTLQAKPSTIWRPPPHSGVSLHSLLCSSLQNPVLWGHLHPSRGPFCPLDWALQPPGRSSALQFPPPSRGHLCSLREALHPSGTHLCSLGPPLSSRAPSQGTLCPAVSCG